MLEWFQDVRGEPLSVRIRLADIPTCECVPKAATPSDRDPPGCPSRPPAYLGDTGGVPFPMLEYWTSRES